MQAVTTKHDRGLYTGRDFDHPFEMLGEPSMRTYAPATADAVLARLLEEPSLARGVVHHEVIPAREAAYADMPATLDPRIVEALHARGIERLYTHRSRR